MDILPVAEAWKMTLNSVVEQIKIKNNIVDNNIIPKSKNFAFLQIGYLSKKFGNLTFEEITKKFIKEYSETSFDQIVANRKFEKTKSKLLYDFLSCQLLVYRPKDNKYEYLTKLIAEIRK